MLLRLNQSIFAIRTVTLTLTIMSFMGTQANAHESMEAMGKAMDSHKMESMSMTGDKDYDFALNMRNHHQSGVEMAQAEIKNGKNPEMIQMAKQIIASQQKDIEKFDIWLKKHGRPKTK